MNSTTGRYRSVAFIRVIRVICLFSNQVLIARKSTQIFTESQILVSIDKNVKDVTATQKRENSFIDTLGSLNGCISLIIGPINSKLEDFVKLGEFFLTL